MEEISEKHYVIYKITNNVNNKIYIGKHITSNINDNYMGSGYLLRRSIQKYGIQQFKKEILYVFDNEKQMNDMEAEIVTEEFAHRKDTYNMTVGGFGGFKFSNSNGLNNKVRQCYIAGERIKNDKEYALIFSNKIKQKLKEIGFTGQYFLNKKHTEESKKKIGMANSIKQKGEKNSQYGTCWIMKDNENKKVKKGELNNWIQQGWTKGRKIK